MIVLALICFIVALLIVATRPWESYEGDPQIAPGVPPWWYPCWFNFAAYGTGALICTGVILLLV